MPIELPPATVSDSPLAKTCDFPSRRFPTGLKAKTWDKA
jgi:hypothetical protein